MLISEDEERAADGKGLVTEYDKEAVGYGGLAAGNEEEATIGKGGNEKEIVEVREGMGPNSASLEQPEIPWQIFVKLL